MYRLDTKTARARLEPRNGPYFVKVMKGRFLGFRKASEEFANWTARAELGNSKRIHKLLGPVSNDFGYDEALAAAREWFKDVDAGITGAAADGTPATVAAACREYVDDRRRQKGEAPAKTTHRIFCRRIYGEPAAQPLSGWTLEPDPIAAVRLDKLRALHLEEWRERAIAAKLSRETVNRELTSLVAALNLAVANRLVSADQSREWKRVKKFKSDGNRRTVYLDLNQRRTLLAAARETFTYTVIKNSKTRRYSPSIRESRGAIGDLIEASMHTGARPGELISATRSAFDGRTHSLTLSGKTGSRTFPLSPAGVAFFDRISKLKLPKAPLLCRDDGKAWNRSDWDEIVRAVVQRAGIPPGTVLYTLRHSWITEAVLSGMSLLEVARMTGTSLAMIDEHYGHLAESTARERLNSITMV